MPQAIPLRHTAGSRLGSRPDTESDLTSPVAKATSLADVPRVARHLAGQLALTAVERDKAGGHARAERELIRQSGLLALTIPTVWGGLGGDRPSFYRVVRELARVDASLAHVFAFHHLQVASVLLYGDIEQQERLLRDTIRHQWFWGNALNPLDKRTLALATSGGFRIRGSKSYCSGSVGSDMMTDAWWSPGR